MSADQVPTIIKPNYWEVSYHLDFKTFLVAFLLFALGQLLVVFWCFMGVSDERIRAQLIEDITDFPVKFVSLTECFRIASHERDR